VSDLRHVSLFSGIGGFELAFERVGVHTVAACELDKSARGVLADQWPDATLFPDVKELTGDDLRDLGLDPGRTVLSAGWPCQGNSVAGRRAGMADARSGLWREVARILAEFRPAWFVGENVPGLLSVESGEDWATVISDLAELGYEFAWRVLDVQHFGVPQRRRRVILVGHLGDGQGPVRILFEPESVCGDSAAGFASGTVVAANVGSGAHASGILGTVAHTLTGEGFVASEDGTGRGTPVIAQALMARDRPAYDPSMETLIAFAGQTGGEGLMPVGALVPTLNVGQVHSVAYAPAVAATITAGQSSPGISAPGRRQEDDQNIVAFHMTQDPISGHDVPAMGAKSGRQGIAYVADTMNALDTAQGGPDDNSAQGGQLVAFQKVIRPASSDHPDVWAERSVAATLSPFDLGSDTRAVEVIVEPEVTVRRLTPVECSRLQGFPDDWTATSNGKPQADSPRYKQLGNAVAVPVIEWVARRLVAESAR
jgi:DNA (cytosine-5)-methyltransferase 1